ncbi:adenylate/guanylate cyclase domain-containing protein [Candidatus Methylobacter oryzae]|uniref:Adenylate/guanylate cyclase domain-containing protein n=1 Tax=Candidatus Methylobacter oryzae TaxID=2497749 RepID=A0ABY3CJ14_9GAMM|nr:adenylate/guanylate cyclase domain-containing protein [Candidatus Methylobacter oryzae]TRX03602.1 adenylate/guanylate cyclase domain-containing protein [Candidatus Methylobacter oryzae]
MKDHNQSLQQTSEELDAESLMAERQRLEALFHEKFTKVITVMFTDLKGSTAITEAEGNLAVRELMKKHNDMLFPILKKHNGVLVKTMGDGTMSYFTKAQDAARAASEFQRILKEYNAKQKPKIPIIVTAGLHTGEGIVEKDDIYGDVVNVAARFDAQAQGSEICVSEETFNALEDKAEIYCRYFRMAKLKGKKDEFKIFKIIWDPDDIEKDKAELAAGLSTGQNQAQAKSGLFVWVAILAIIAIGIIAVTLLIKGNELFTGFSSSEERRSARHTIAN